MVQVGYTLNPIFHLFYIFVNLLKESRINILKTEKLLNQITKIALLYVEYFFSVWVITCD